MVKNVKYIVSGSGILSLWIETESGTKSFSVGEDHPNHFKIVEALKTKKYDDLIFLLDIKSFEEEKSKKVAEAISAAKMPESLANTAEVRNGQIYVNSVPVHNLITERIVKLVQSGYPVEPALRFLENVLMNPSSRAQEELYDFLANRSLPLTEDGCFLAYKRVREDWTDFHTGKIDNRPGTVVEVPFEAVDPNRDVECSYGLHLGGPDYVRGFHSGQGHVVICKSNPKDCVSVPKDHNHQKLRTRRYESLYEVEGDKLKELDRPVYRMDGSESGFYSYSDCFDLPEGCRYTEVGWDTDYENMSTHALRLLVMDRVCGYSEEELGDMFRAELMELLWDLDAEEEEERLSCEDDEENDWSVNDLYQDECEDFEGTAWDPSSSWCLDMGPTATHIPPDEPQEDEPDFVDEIVAERSATNPDFPQMVAKAENDLFLKNFDVQAPSSNATTSVSVVAPVLMDVSTTAGQVWENKKTKHRVVITAISFGLGGTIQISFAPSDYNFWTDQHFRESYSLILDV